MALTNVEERSTQGKDEKVMGDPMPNSDDEQELRDYNYAHFRTKHFIADLLLTLRGAGVAPGTEAPDFVLEATSGEPVRLSSLRGRPVLLHFGSLT